MSQFFGGVSGGRIIAEQLRGEAIADEAGFLAYCAFALPQALIVPGAMFVQKSSIRVARATGGALGINLAQVSQEETQWAFGVGGADDSGVGFINLETVYFINTDAADFSASFSIAARLPNEVAEQTFISSGVDELILAVGTDTLIETQLEIDAPSADDSLQRMFSTLIYFPPA